MTNMLVNQSNEGEASGPNWRCFVEWHLWVTYIVIFTLFDCKNNYLPPKSSRKIDLLIPLKRLEDQKFYVYANIIISNGALAPD